MIKFHIEGEIDDVAIKKAKRIIKKIIHTICKHEKIKGKHFISFIIVDNDEIQRINKEYRKIDRPTDVITFASIDGEVDHKLPEELGDIFISRDKVIEQANEYEHSLLREFAFLVTHGLLHALGYDHMTEEDEIEMFKLQDEILNTIKIVR